MKLQSLFPTLIQIAVICLMIYMAKASLLSTMNGYSQRVSLEEMSHPGPNYIRIQKNGGGYSGRHRSPASLFYETFASQK